ncbi:MarR family winged helix-turn-helix transcriptional regulator [Roseisolibacter sp. H3M3-2]|uniref:MarR family winged helix-turn-helix transcriptional regulator n=1 Tax=Roseisolibacter sp. H3M3-2 TaxID=3031323 RepID=UPI0023D9DBDA|nr:MarR family winged helix-turn-helix transcriptional regulator [Roseisolibacter sp. H3M3-2]MDF1503223.1 MarR family winged helix-turn-helix transcriptional regulator [Roseisolibacter sp. H3M3-2]
MPTSPPTLGTLLRHLLDQLDGDVERVYAMGGLEYRPRFTPVMRVLGEQGPVSIREIADHARISHSAVSQTVAEMVARKLVVTRTGGDARERIVHFTPRGKALYPVLRAYWRATNAAAAGLSDELGIDLPATLERAIAALRARPFRERILEQHAVPEEPATASAPARRRPAREASRRGA